MEKEESIGDILCCPKCKRRFSDYFIWDDGERYCYPCQGLGGPRDARGARVCSIEAMLIKESDGVYLRRCEVNES